MAKYSLTKNSVMIARSMLNQPGACKTIEDIFRAGRLMASVLKDYGELKEPERDELVEVELDGPDRDVIKAALTVSLEKGVIPASPWLSDLMEKLELVSKK